MRRIVVFNRVTADGYFAGIDGNLDWVVPDAELDKAAGAGTAGFDTMLFGRRTYEMFEGFWPHAVGDSTALDPHGDGRRSEAMHAMGVWINEATKIVFSRTRKEVKWSNSRLIPKFDPGDIEAMKSGPGNDMIVFGSGSIVSKLTEHDLVDEYQFVVGPLLLGSGRPMISGVSKISSLKLVETKTFASGNVMLRYARN